MSFHGKGLGRAGAACVALFFVSCLSPLPTTDTSGDAIEFESVWQYLKAFSIYQDSGLYQGLIPADPFVIASPEKILLSVHDTLKALGLNDLNHTYTRYDDQAGVQAGANVRTPLSAAGSTAVFFDRLTDSTGLMTITTFYTQTVYNDFRYLVPAVAPFPNLVIDLRGNLGGYIEQSDSVIAAMVPSGTDFVLVRERDFDSAAKKYVTFAWHPWRTKPGQFPEFARKRLAVIMDGSTASASELAVSAFYEGKRAALIGSRSYGKGIGQVSITRRTRRPLLITSLQFKGVSARIGDYHRHGIAPDSVPAAVVREADSAHLSDWQKSVFYAVKRLEPAATPRSIRFPAPHAASLGKTAAAIGLKVLDVQEDGLPRAAR